MTSDAIEVDDLHKSYGDVEAVRGVCLSVARGEVLCLLGPNGAGKTTTTEILEGYRVPTTGRVSVLGHDPARGERALRERVGIVLQECGVQPDLTVGELLELYGRYYPRERRRAPGELLELVGLEGRARARAGQLSGGQRRRLDLALALVGDPDLVFLDEPTTGFDPGARRQAWDTLKRLCRDAGKTIWLTTHFMDEAQALADRIAVMREGRIVACGTPDELGGRDTAPTEIRFVLPPGTSLADLPALAREARVSEPDPGHALVVAPDGVRAAHALTAWALERGHTLRGFTVVQPTLEDVYLQLTQEPTPA